MAEIVVHTLLFLVQACCVLIIALGLLVTAAGLCELWRMCSR